MPEIALNHSFMLTRPSQLGISVPNFRGEETEMERVKAIATEWFSGSPDPLPFCAQESSISPHPRRRGVAPGCASGREMWAEVPSRSTTFLRPVLAKHKGSKRSLCHTRSLSSSIGQHHSAGPAWTHRQWKFLFY